MFMINKYPRWVPFHKAIYKNLLYHIRKARLYYKNGKQHKTVLFYPEFPKSRSAMYNTFREMDYNITNNPNEEHEFLIAWEDTTSRPEYDYLNEKNKIFPVPNIHNREIGKTHIDTAFLEVFGYSLLIDPTTHKGKALKKTEINGGHDGTVIECPIKPEEIEEDYSYQILIDNEVKKDHFQDIRVPIVKGVIPFVFEKMRPPNGRFGTGFIYMVIEPTRKMLSEEEEQKIIAYCDKIKLDIGKLDVLRDQGSGRIYIVDVNNTPCLSRRVPKKMYRQYLDEMIPLIQEKLMKPQAGKVWKK